MALIDNVGGLLAVAQGQMDRFVSPDTRHRGLQRVQAFATARPLLFTFIVSQVLTSLLPVALFLAFTTSVLVLSVGAALLFSLFWLGVAMLFLIPTLFVTISLGFLVFTWAVAARFAWAALPSSLKRSITTGRGRRGGAGGSSSSAPSSGARPRPSGIWNGAQGRAESRDVTEAPRPPPESAFKGEANGGSDGVGAAAVLGVADLEKFKEEKDGEITP